MSIQIRLTKGALFALTGVLLLSFAASLGMAFNIDAIASSFNVTNTTAGLVASVEMAAIAVGNLTFARLATRLSAQRTYLAGVLAVVSMNILSIIAPTTDWLLLCRAPAGFALGAVVATVMTTAGRSHKPELTFGVINSMVGVMGILIAFVLPRALDLHLVLPAITDWSEVDGLYLVYAISSIFALLFIPATPLTEAVVLSEDAAERPKLMVGWLGLVGLGIIFFGHGTLALFIVKIGRAVSLSPEVIGYVFMVGSSVGVGLPLLAGYIGTRMNALIPIALILLVVAVSAFLLASAGTPLQFFIVAPLFAVLPVAIMPIFLGCLSRVDPTGSLAGSHAAFVLIGGALAPFAGGALSDLGGFSLNGWFVIGCLVVGALLIYPVIMRADSHRV
ncbi:MAG: MFS transporter [Pseudomonadales bacterium]|nr:MFS transporter [Pseudomonadales bacterium]